MKKLGALVEGLGRAEDIEPISRLEGELAVRIRDEVAFAPDGGYRQVMPAPRTERRNCRSLKAGTA